MRKWLIVYDGGAVFTNEDGPPELAPRTGVQVVYNRDAEGATATGFLIEKSRFGYWGWRDDYGWVAFQTESGFWDYLMSPGHRVIPLFGRTLRHDAYCEQMKKAGELITGWVKNNWTKVEKGRNIEP